MVDVQHAMPTVQTVLADASSSRALKAVLSACLARDAVDAANDAACLAEVLERRWKGDGG